MEINHEHLTSAYEVVPHPRSRYFGAQPGERTLIPGRDVRQGETAFDTWLSQSVNPQPLAGPANHPAGPASGDPPYQREGMSVEPRLFR